MQQENVRFMYFLILRSKPHVQVGLLKDALNDSQFNWSDAHLFLSPLPFSGWEAPRSLASAFLHLLPTTMGKR